MNLDRFTVHNLHGRLDARFGAPCVFITGPNRSGKTSLLRALVTLIACDTRSVARNLGAQPPGMTITATLDGVEHEASVGADGRLAHKIGHVHTPPRQAQEQRAAAFGEAALWSVDRFIGEASKEERATFMAQRIIGDVFTASSIDAVLRESGDGLDEVVKVLRAQSMRVSADDPKLLDALLENSREAARAAQETSLRLARTVAQEEEDRDKRRLPPGTVAHWRAEVERLGELLANARVTREASVAAATRFERATARREKVERRLQELSVPSEREDVAALEAAMREIDGKITAAATLVETCNAGMIASGQAVMAAEREAARLEDRATDTRRAYESCMPVLRLVDVAREMAELLPEGHDLRVEAGFAIDGLTGQTTRADVDAAAAAHAVAVRAVESANKAHQEATVRWFDANQAHKRDVRDLQNERATLAQRKQRAEVQAVFAAREANERIDLERELADLQEQLADAVAPTLEPDVTAAYEAQRAAAQRNADAINDAVQADAALAKHRAARDEAKATATRLRELRGRLEQVRHALLARYTDPVADIASAMMQRVLQSSIAVRSGEVLITNAAGAIYSIDTASDGERVVALVALSVAVRSRLPGWRAAIVDRLDALTPDLADRLARALVEQQRAGVIDNLIIASHHAPDAALDADLFQLVRLGGAA